MTASVGLRRDKGASPQPQARDILDAALRAAMPIALAKLHRQLKATMIHVTHDQVEAMTMADRIVVLDSGDISQTGAPLELYHKPANQFVAGFIGNLKLIFFP